ncbi:MAG: hypothetical protein R3F11_17005 [Verrucomicrobiales bacterium]
MAPPPAGTRQSTAISITMRIAAATTSRLRPNWSASAPDGTSSNTIATAHATFNTANCETLNPRSRNRIA